MTNKALATALMISTAWCGAALADTAIGTDARKSLSVTVYNGGSALVRDTRSVSVDAGRSVLSFVDVAAQIQPETALLKGARFDVLEQNFDFDLLSPDKLLDKALGGPVTLVKTNPATGEETSRQATLLGAANGVVLQVGDRIETMQGTSGPAGRLVFETLPADLRSRPTLSMTVNAAAADSRDLMLTYLTEGLGWKADYVANLAPDEKSLSLQGWITVTNTTGATYRDARLQVVAGQVNRVSQRYERDMVAAAPRASKVQGVPVEESFFEYHLYTLPQPVTLSDNQTKQVALLEAPKIAATRVLESRGGGYWYMSRVGEMQSQPANISLTFDNRDQTGLGRPLPGGVIRVYKDDARGDAQFVGEDRMNHTPRNEEVVLNLGQAFDVTVKRTQTDFRQQNRPDGQLSEATSTWEVVVKNGKKEPVDVRVIETLQGDWTVTAESLAHKKQSATEAVWTVRAPAEGQTTFTYTVLTRNQP
jgi:hypothetical protein